MHLGRLLLTALCGTSTADLAGAASGPADYIVFELDGSGAVHPLYHRVVELALRPGASKEPLVEDASGAVGGALSLPVRLRNAHGTIVFQSRVRVPGRIRSELAGKPFKRGGSPIEGRSLPDPDRVFVVRVPLVPGARLELDGPTPASFALDALAGTAGFLPHAMQSMAPSEPLDAPEGDPANRVDLLIMGDGYTAAERSKFEGDAATLRDEFFAISPYAEYRNYVNVTMLFTASPQSGADHPPHDPDCASSNLGCCADEDTLSDDLAGTYVDTAFDAHYCAFGIHRLLVVNSVAVAIAAAEVPDWDHIIVLVNDSTYGGSGGSLAVASTHPASVDIMRHEYGHSFTDLADEYETPNPEFPACSDVSGPACERNVTDVTVRSLVKWEPWIQPATPVPTPESVVYANKVGLFEGARYLESGMYRPRDTQCLMRTLGQPFCEVCRQAYVHKLYEGGWGVPNAGIDLIEPDTEVPPPGEVGVGPGGRTFSADLLEPVGGPPVDVVWLVDGVPAVSGVSSFDFVPSAQGDYEIELQAEDVTGFVHPELASASLRSERLWMVHVPEPGAAALLSAAVASLATLHARRASRACARER